MMPDPVTMAALMATPVGNVMTNIVCGLVTNALQAGGDEAWARVNGWWNDGKTPQNHDVLKATHAAYVAAMGKMAAAATVLAWSDEEVTAAKALTAKIAEPKFKDFRWDGEHLPLAECQARIETLFAGRHMPGAEDDGWRLFNQTVVDDLAAWGVPLPPRLTALFVAGEDAHAPWHLVFRAEFAEVLKADEKKPEGERSFRILTFERLNELTAAGAVLADGVAELQRGMAVLIEGQKADRARDEAFQAQVLALLGARSGGSEDRLLLEIADILEVQPDIDPAALAQEIREREAQRKAQAAELAANPATDNLIRQHQNAGAQALLDNDDRTFVAEMEAAEAELRSRRESDAQLDADLKRQRGDALLRLFDWQAADAAWSEAEALLAPFDRTAAESKAWDAADALQSHGDRFASLAALAAAAARWRGLRDAAQRRDDSERAAAINNRLGNALQVQGERSGGEAGLALLAEAVAAYRAALAVRTRDAAPADWAMTQNNLGIALRVQGERSGGEAGLALLAEAVAAYRAALEVRTRDAAPADWAMTQNNLGNALSVQGERSGGAAGLALLADAVAAYRAALEVRTRDAAPADWAMTQNNLGNALLAQGERSGGAAGLALLAEAVSAYRAALEVLTRDAAPADWATTQMNMATAELARSRASAGAAARSFALAAREACVAALSVYSPEHMAYYHGTATALLQQIDARLTDLAAE